MGQWCDLRGAPLHPAEGRPRPPGRSVPRGLTLAGRGVSDWGLQRWREGALGVFWDGACERLLSRNTGCRVEN